MAHNAVFVAIEAEGQHWTVKADTLTAGPGRGVTDAVNDAIRTAILRLVDAREVDFAKLAAALHAALHEDLEPLSRAVPPASSLR